MSNRLFQSVVHQMRDTIDCVIGVIDENATIIACSELSNGGTTRCCVSSHFWNHQKELSFLQIPHFVKTLWWEAFGGLSQDA